MKREKFRNVARSVGGLHSMILTCDGLFDEMPHRASTPERYIPTGVLFYLLCVELQRPWNLTVHFRGYAGNLLIPCEGENSVK